MVAIHPAPFSIAVVEYGGKYILTGRVRDYRIRKGAVDVELRSVSTDTALRLIADMQGFKMVQVDNVYYVTSMENTNMVRKEMKERCGKAKKGTTEKKKEAKPKGK